MHSNCNTGKNDKAMLLHYTIYFIIVIYCFRIEFDHNHNIFLEVFSFQFCMFRKPLLAFPLMVFFLTLDDMSFSSDVHKPIIQAQ